MPWLLPSGHCGCSLFDEGDYRRWLRHVDGVAGGDLGHRGTGRADIERWAAGGIIRSSVVSRYQLGLARQAGSVIVPPSASTPHGTCESAMNAASSAGTSPAKESWNLSRSNNKNPSTGGRIGGCGASGGKPARSVLTDSPWSGANARDVQQRRHVRVGACLGDDCAAVGVANQDDRAVLRVDDQPGREAASPCSDRVGFCTTATW